jgi:hypothetical protein
VLRGQVLAGAMVRGDAVTLSVRVIIEQGMLAWMAAFASLPQASCPRANHVPPASQRCGAPRRAELVSAFASLILNHHTTEVGA